VEEQAGLASRSGMFSAGDIYFQSHLVPSVGGWNDLPMNEEPTVLRNGQNRCRTRFGDANRRQLVACGVGGLGLPPGLTEPTLTIAARRSRGPAKRLGAGGRTRYQ
jgi:hypothetical protein